MKKAINIKKRKSQFKIECYINVASMLVCVVDRIKVKKNFVNASYKVF